MSYRHIVLEISADGVALLTVNRPEKLNALNAKAIEELGAALRQIEGAQEVRAVLLTGTGNKAFVAGADIEELAGASPFEFARLSRSGQDVFRHLELLGKPSIAALNGYALGGGLELAMACTLRVAATGAKLGQPEVKLGLTPGYGGSQRLPRLIGRGRALEMLLTGEPVPAQEALAMGLVNHVVEAGELLDFSRKLLLRMTANGPLALALTMQAVDLGLEAGLDAGLRFESSAFALAAASADRNEGIQAFLGKRRPVFSGR